MGLEFYRAATRDKINYNEYVGLEGELQDFLYKNRHLIDCDVKCIYEIDPYDDTELSVEQIHKIISV